MLIFSVCIAVCLPVTGYGQTDTTAAVDTTAAEAPKKVDAAGHQLSLGFDMFHPVTNRLYKDRQGYEIIADYYMRNEYYAVAEGGWGGSEVSYTDLNYKSTNTYVRAGFNRSLLARQGVDDWDMMFIGLRAAFTSVKRSSAEYTIADSVWGTSSGAQPSQRFPAYWAEITAGMRVQVWKRIYTGWTIRGKFMLNSRSFKNIAPLYIAGYGKGDINAAFDFSVYAIYQIRWPRSKPATAKTETDK